MLADGESRDFSGLSLFENKLLWTARSCARRGVKYTEISDTNLAKPEAARELKLIHGIMPAITRETGVTIRFLAAMRRIPLTIVRDNAAKGDFGGQLRVIRAIAPDPYIAGSDIVGEEINDIRELKPVLRELADIAGENEGFVIRIHAGENDGLRDNVANSLACVRASLRDGQKMPELRIGHGLYTANLISRKGQKLIRELRENGVTLEFQITSNVRLNNLSELNRHPLRQYLSGGVNCVQGTDGGAIYGTDSIDEQLALERLLDLSFDEMLAMRRAENEILERSMKAFEEKSQKFSSLVGDGDIEAFLSRRIGSAELKTKDKKSDSKKLESAVCLKGQIRELPSDKIPVILLGGSFNSGNRSTRVTEPLRELVRRLTDGLDPDKCFFVTGNRMTGYERELTELAAGKFEIFAIVPTEITPPEAVRLKRAGVGIRVSIEPTGMGLYKSFAYEIFKRRPSVVVALDGNSAGANTIQEAKNGKKKAKIFVSRHAATLSAKARALQGYVTVFDGTEAAEDIIAATEKMWRSQFDTDS